MGAAEIPPLPAPPQKKQETPNKQEMPLEVLEQNETVEVASPAKGFKIKSLKMVKLTGPASVFEPEDGDAKLKEVVEKSEKDMVSCHAS